MVAVDSDFFNCFVNRPKATRNLLVRASVLSIALVTYRFQPEMAHDFWPRLARDSGLIEGDPAHTLLRWLRETPARHYDNGSYARHVAAAWNAAYEGRQLFRLLARQPTQPLLVAGTPHEGNVHKVYLRPTGEVLAAPEAVGED